MKTVEVGWSERIHYRTYVQVSDDATSEDVLDIFYNMDLDQSEQRETGRIKIEYVRNSNE